jgi:hypothetical protein
MSVENAVESRYRLMVERLAKPGFTISSQMTGPEAHLIHMVLGVSGEAGELLDAVKKHTIYKKPLDRENVVEELGDLEFYLEGLRASLGITRLECLVANSAKLSVRYASQVYTDADAQSRNDKGNEA